MVLKAGIVKLIAHESQVISFARWGYPDWFMYLIGGLEVAGVIGLFIPKLRSLAIFGIIGIMLGAMYTHIVVDNMPTHLGGSIAVTIIGIAILVLRKGESTV